MRDDFTDEVSELWRRGRAGSAQTRTAERLPVVRRTTQLRLIDRFFHRSQDDAFSLCGTLAGDLLPELGGGRWPLRANHSQWQGRTCEFLADVRWRANARCGT